FGEIAELSRDVDEDCGEYIDPQRKLRHKVVQVKVSNNDRKQNRSGRSFPGFSGTDTRGKFVAAEEPAAVVCGSIGGPSDQQNVHGNRRSAMFTELRQQ